MPLKFISELLSTNTLLNFFLFFITFYITYKVLIKFLKQKKVAIIVGISAGLIAMYYIEFNELLFTFNLYGYTGTTLLLIFPLLFAIFFMYARSITQGIRKLFFVFYGIISIFLVNNLSPLTLDQKTYIMIGIIILTIIIIIFDNSIKRSLNFPGNIHNR